MAQTISIIDVILAKALAISASKAYTDQKTQSLMGGVHYRGQVDYYDDLPNDPEEGDSYTVKYAGSSGTVADGTEYTWGVDSSTNTMTWISFSKDAYSKAETDLLLAAKQSLIDASNKLDGSLVGPLTGYVAAATAAALDPTDTLLQALGKLEKAADDNKNNISSFVTPIVGGITWNLDTLGTAPTVNTNYIIQSGKFVYIQLYVEFANALSENQENIIGALTGVDAPKYTVRERCWQGEQLYSADMISCFLYIGTSRNIVITPPTGATNKKYIINFTYQTN